MALPPAPLKLVKLPSETVTFSIRAVTPLLTRKTLNAWLPLIAMGPAPLPSMVMLLDEHPITVNGQFVWSVEHFSHYPNFPTTIPLVRAE